jgi:hypothetical protein
MLPRGLWGRVARGWRWLRSGPTWDDQDVEQLYGKQASRGYGAGIGEMVNRQEDRDRTRRAERRFRRRGRG